MPFSNLVSTPISLSWPLSKTPSPSQSSPSSSPLKSHLQKPTVLSERRSPPPRKQATHPREASYQHKSSTLKPSLCASESTLSTSLASFALSPPQLSSSSQGGWIHSPHRLHHGSAQDDDSAVVDEGLEHQCGRQQDESVRHAGKPVHNSSSSSSNNDSSIFNTNGCLRKDKHTAIQFSTEPGSYPLKSNHSQLDLIGGQRRGYKEEQPSATSHWSSSTRHARCFAPTAKQLFCNASMVGTLPSQSLHLPPRSSSALFHFLSDDHDAEHDSSEATNENMQRSRHVVIPLSVTDALHPSGLSEVNSSDVSPASSSCLAYGRLPMAFHQRQSEACHASLVREEIRLKDERIAQLEWNMRAMDRGIETVEKQAAQALRVRDAPPCSHFGVYADSKTMGLATEAPTVPERGVEKREGTQFFSELCAWHAYAEALAEAITVYKDRASTLQLENALLHTQLEHRAHQLHEARQSYDARVSTLLREQGWAISAHATAAEEVERMAALLVTARAAERAALRSLAHTKDEIEVLRRSGRSTEKLLCISAHASTAAADVNDFLPLELCSSSTATSTACDGDAVEVATVMGPKVALKCLHPLCSSGDNQKESSNILVSISESGASGRGTAVTTAVPRIATLALAKALSFSEHDAFILKSSEAGSEEEEKMGQGESDSTRVFNGEDVNMVAHADYHYHSTIERAGNHKRGGSDTPISVHERDATADTEQLRLACARLRVELQNSQVAHAQTVKRLEKATQKMREQESAINETEARMRHVMATSRRLEGIFMELHRVWTMDCGSDEDDSDY